LAQTNAPAPGPGGQNGQSSTSGQKSSVDLRLYLTYVDPNGNALNNAHTKSLTSAAKVAWSGTFGNYVVTANFHDKNATQVVVTLDPKGGVSNTNTLGGNSVHLFEGGYQRGNGPITTYTPATLRTTFDHEIGHVLGAKDQYNGSNGVAFPNHARDIMGSVQVGNRSLGTTVREILIFNGETP